MSKLTSKATITFPPEYDGELHLKITHHDDESISFEGRIAKIPGDSTLQTLRKLGVHLTHQPIRLTIPHQE